METYSFALQTLTVIDSEVVATDGTPFNRVAYSQFKYGLASPATTYGLGLAALISDKLREIAGDKPIRIVSAPYKYLPTASHAIAQVLCRELSRTFVEAGLEPPVLVPLHKARTGSSAYAKSTEADRLKSLATLGLHLDESLIAGAHVLVVDDIRITGSAEKATDAYLKQLNPASIWYLHAARLSVEVGKAHPALEDLLNQTVPHTLQGVLRQESEGDFRLNTRVLRHILETESSTEFRMFVMAAPIALLEEIHQAAVGSGVTYFTKYSHQLQIISHELKQRRAPAFADA